MNIVRYSFVGAFAAAVDITIFGVAVKIFEFNWFNIAILSFMVATSVNYFLSIGLVFKSEVRFSRRHEISLVFIVSTIGLIANQIALIIFIEMAHFDELTSKILATSLVFFWNYSARAKYIFKKLN